MGDAQPVKKITRNIGVRDIYIAKVIENTINSYKTDTPYKLARALSIKLSDKFNTDKLYSDDMLEDIAECYDSTDVELKTNTLSNEDYSHLYNVLYDNGFLVKSAEDTAQEVALGFRSKRLDGTYDFTWLYAGKFSDRPEEEYDTLEDKPAPKDRTIKGTFSARQKPDTIGGKEKHLYQVKVNECELIDDNTEAKEAITNWFKEVQEYKEHATTTSGSGSDSGSETTTTGA